MERLSYSRLSAWKSCKAKHHWRYKIGVVPKEQSENLIFGKRFHKVLEKDTPSGDEVIDTVYADYLKTYEEESKLDILETDKVLKEFKFEISLKNHLDTDAKFIGYVDKIVLRKDGYIDIWDYKTSGSFPKTDMFPFRDQSILYWWAAKQYFPDYIPGNFVWDYINRKPAKMPKILKDGSLSSDVRGVIPASVLRAGREITEFPEDRQNEIINNEEKYFKRTLIPFNASVYETCLENLFTSIGELIKDSEEKEVPIFNISSSCDWCEYAPLCRMLLSCGDVEGLIGEEFMKKENDRGEEDV